MAGGYVPARLVQAASSLGLFAAIGDGEATAAEVAAACRTDPRATDLALRALAALELLELRAAGRFALAPVARAYLVPGSPSWFGPMLAFEAGLWGEWAKLEDAIRHGGPVREPNAFQDRKEETERFILAMHALAEARGDAALLPRVLDLSGATSMLDVGSGPGTYPIHFCRHYPRLRATIFDLPGTLTITRRIVDASGLGERIELVAGDYRTDELPGTHDVVFLSNIVHSEDEATNERLIASAARVLRPGGRVIVKDHVLDESGVWPRHAALFSLTMVLLTRGRDYRLSEIAAWMEKAGLADVREVRLAPPLASSLVIASRPPADG